MTSPHASPAARRGAPPRPASLRRTTALSAVGLGLVLTLGACGGDDGGSEPSETVPADSDLVVTAVKSIRWDQTAYTAPAGEITVTLVNEDSLRHDLIIREGDQKVGDLELVVQEEGDVATGSITLEPGTYSVYCIVPGHSQMDSELTVG